MIDPMNQGQIASYMKCDFSDYFLSRFGKREFDPNNADSYPYLFVFEGVDYAFNIRDAGNFYGGIQLNELE